MGGGHGEGAVLVGRVQHARVGRGVEPECEDGAQAAHGGADKLLCWRKGESV